jgi:YVTN family beta-propeller protein
MQTAALAPDGIHLWIPNNMINTSAGALFGNPLTPLNIVHACIRPVNTVTSTDRNLDTYFLSEGGSPNLGFPGGTTPVGGPIQVAFQGGRAYVANLHSDNVTVLNDNIFSPAEIDVIPAGSAPIGVLAHPTLNRVYVHNWLSRDVTVIDTANLAVVATVATTTSEVLPSPVLNGKRLFFTGQGPMSLDGRGACASCHVFGKHDGRMWDLSQFGKHVRATPDIRGIAFTGAHDFTADKNEMADHDLGIVEFMGGDGLIPSPNPPLGPPNAGLSQDMDDIGIFMSILEHRPDTPFLAPGGGLTAEADSGRALFFDPAVGCATCHVPPFFSDSRLPQPFIKHVVGTANPGDLDAAPGFDTPSLVGVWDNAPYLHHHLAQTLLSVMTTFNPNDLHGATSQLTSAQLEKIVAYLKSLAHPDSAGVSVVAPETLGDVSGALEAIFPNPFDEKTSLRFSTEKSPSQVTIEIFNVEGRRVRRLLDAPMARGIHIVGWDARNDSGRRVAPGTYYANLFVDRARRAGKTMTVVR